MASASPPTQPHVRLGCLVVLGFLAAGSAAADELVWRSGFENGFPGGEWLDYDNGSFSQDGSMPGGRVSAWTIVQSDNGVPAPAGNFMYKGWIVGAAADSHRAYPVIHCDHPTPLVNSFLVYLDADYDQLSTSDWIHFGTWGNPGKWALHTMSVRDRKLRFAHTDPFEGEYIGPDPRPDFPLRTWVRFTTYLHYEGDHGFAQVWQDGVPMLRAQVIELQGAPGTNLQRAHWGMYAASSVDHGIQLNDEITICTLSAPLSDLVTEPSCGQDTSPPAAPQNLTIE